MRLALFSDVHGHVTGLKAVSDRIHHLGGADRICALGGFAGGDPGLDDVIDLLLEHDAMRYGTREYSSVADHCKATA